MVPTNPFNHSAKLGSVHIISTFRTLQVLHCLHYFTHIPWCLKMIEFRLIKKFTLFVRVTNTSSANSVLSPSSVFYSQFREFPRVADKTELPKV